MSSSQSRVKPSLHGSVSHPRSSSLSSRIFRSALRSFLCSLRSYSHSNSDFPAAAARTALPPFIFSVHMMVSIFLVRAHGGVGCGVALLGCGVALLGCSTLGVALQVWLSETLSKGLSSYHSSARSSFTHRLHSFGCHVR